MKVEDQEIAMRLQQTGAGQPRAETRGLCNAATGSAEVSPSSISKYKLFSN